MKPLTWARVNFRPHAYAMLQRMDGVHTQRFWRIVSVIKNAPEDGAFAGEAPDGAILRQMTGSDTHVIYTVTHWHIGRVLLVVRIEIRDWEPLDH